MMTRGFRLWSDLCRPWEGSFVPFCSLFRPSVCWDWWLMVWVCFPLDDYEHEDVLAVLQDRIHSCLDSRILSHDALFSLMCNALDGKGCAAPRLKMGFYLFAKEAKQKPLSGVRRGGEIVSPRLHLSFQWVFLHRGFMILCFWRPCWKTSLKVDRKCLIIII